MEEKERYKVYKDNRGNAYICDTIKNIDYKIYQEFVDLLNQQSKRLKELEEELDDGQKYNELKQQLHDLPKNIVEEIKIEMSGIEDILINCGNGKEDALSWFNRILQTILKKYDIEYDLQAIIEQYKQQAKEMFENEQ